MKTYIYTKTAIAKPMTRQAYNDLRGWTLPADEDGTDAGYLVEYTAVGRTNNQFFTGCIRWVPADVFNLNYHEIDMPAEDWGVVGDETAT